MGESDSAGESEARLSRKILGVDGSVVLHVNQRVFIETISRDRDARIADITDAGITVYVDTNPFIAWNQIRKISTRHGPERKWWIPAAFAMVGSGVLGYCGWWIDGLSHSTSGRDPKGAGMMLGIVIGACVLGLPGMLIMYAFPGPKWITLVRVPTGTPALTLATFAARVEETARARRDA